MELAQNRIKAFPLYMGNSGCDYHRVKLPFLCGGEHYDHEVYNPFDVAKLLEYFAISEVVVLNRYFPFGVDKMKEFQAQGVKFVVDLDDWIELPWYHPNYEQYRSGHAALIKGCIEAADLVTVTTQRLWQKTVELNKNTHVLPNALPFGHGQFRPHPAPPPRTTDAFRFIYTGQSSHLEDVRLLQAPINQVKKLPNVAFSLAGWKANSVWDAIDRVFNGMPNYERIEARDLSNYMTVYDGADCSVVPLCLNFFNSCKSNLKMLEAAAKKIPIVISHVPPYRDDHDAPALWVKTPADWVKHMKYLAENPNAASDLGEALHEWATSKYNLTYWNMARFEMYKSLLS